MKAKVSISRGSDDKVRIRIRDVESSIEFAEVALTMESYGYVITGLSEQEAELEVRGLQWVGKRNVTEQRIIECPLNSYNRDELRAWLRENAQENGWMLSDYLGSQDSVTRKGDKTILRYSVTKYVDA
jgi:DNA helicase TIP49 (TBP-interacting protein)